MVPPQLAQKMSVLSVEPLALGGPGEIGAERAQRPGSRRLGGVEATGASVATADSWPDRRKGWASPEWGPALRLAVMGGMAGRRKEAVLGQVRPTSAGSRMNSRAIPGAKKKGGHLGGGGMPGLEKSPPANKLAILSPY